MKILIGSQCIKHWYPDFNRVPKDIDYAVNKEIKSEPNIEYLYNPVLFKYTPEFKGDITWILDPNLL